MRFARPARLSTLASPNVLPQHYAKPTLVSPPCQTWVCLTAADPDPVAKIDALQAEYSAFETLHETDGLIEAAKELGVAYVAYSPLGHGWLVDDFPYKTPDDFAPNDFRRSGKSIQGLRRSPGRVSR